MKKYFAAVLLAGFIFWAPLTVSRADDASSGVSSTEVLKKLDEVTQNQTKILQSLEEVKSELQAVKVRVTSR